MGADNQQERLNANWVVGFVDGEGCFYVGINHPKNHLQILPEFRIVQHKNNEDVLFKLKDFFGCGNVTVNHGDRKEVRVRGIKNLKIIVDFFSKYPLKTKKQNDFEKFSEIIKLMSKKKHLSEVGLKKISELVCQMQRRKKRLKSSETICQTPKGEDIVRP